MNKKVTIFAVALIVIGIIGTISSSIAAVPFATNYVKELEKEANEEVTIYEKKVNVSQVEIETHQVNVEIRKSNSDKLKIVQLGKSNNKTFTIDNKDKIFSIKENYKNNDINMHIQGFGDAILEMMRMGPNKMIVYVPENVDIKVSTLGGSLIIDDRSIVLDNLEFNTSYGQIFLPNEIKSIKNLKLSSTDTISLKMSEILGIENVNISSGYDVNIESTPNDVLIDNVENYIPKQLNIIGNDELMNVYIDSDIPVAKNLNIINKSGHVNIDLPIDYYNIDFDLDSEQSINIDDNNDSNNQDNSIKEFKGRLSDTNKEGLNYTVNVKSQSIDIRR